MSTSSPRAATLLAAESVELYPQVLALPKLSPPTTLGTVPQPPVTPATSAVVYSVFSSEVQDVHDRTAYAAFTLAFQEEMKMIEQMKGFLKEGEEQLAIIYSYRSVSKAIPMIQNDTPDEIKDKMHSVTFIILRPEMDKLLLLMAFHERLIKMLKAAFQSLSKFEKSGAPSDAILENLVRMIDLCVKLDALKDRKSSIMNDFTRYKRSFAPLHASKTFTDSDAISNQIKDLQFFLSNPQCTSNIILFHLKDDLQMLPNLDFYISLLLQFSLNSIDQRQFVTVDDFHMYHRVLPSLLYILSHEDKEGKKGLNVFKYNGKHKLDFDRIRREIKRLPFVPVYMDIHLDCYFMLKKIPHWDEEKYGSEYVSKSQSKIENNYSLTAYISEARIANQSFLTEFSSHAISAQSYISSHSTLPYSVLSGYSNALLQGVKLVAEWSGRVQRHLTWKYAHPLNMADYNKIKLEALGHSQSSGSQSGSLSGNDVGSEYEKAIRYNFSPEELYALIDTIGMIKNLSAVLLKDPLLNDLIIRRYIHDNVQTFVIGPSVSEPLRSAAKKNRSVKDVMQNIRDLAADWKNYATQKDAYKEKHKRKPSDASDNASVRAGQEFPIRPIALAPTQILLLRRILLSVFHERNPGMQGGLFSDKDLKKEEVTQWQDFYHLSYFFETLLNFTQNVFDVSNLSFLWFREFYLELTKSTQYPITHSLPWICLSSIFHGSSITTAGTLLDHYYALLDIYNDGAQTALVNLRSQYLFDEIESEMNLIVTQVIFFLSRQVLNQCKLQASSLLVDHQFYHRYQQWKESSKLGKTKISSTTNSQAFSMFTSRFSTILSQTTLPCIGRLVNISQLITEQVRALLITHADAILGRLEHCSLSALFEFKVTLEHFKILHSCCSSLLPSLDTCDSIWKDVNQNVHVGHFQSRLLRHVYAECCLDLFPHTVFNDTTQRFIQIHLQAQKLLELPSSTDSTLASTERPSLPASCANPLNGNSFFFGKPFGAFYHHIFQSYRGYVGKEHLDALVSLTSTCESDLPLLMHEIIKECETKFAFDFLPYTEVLLTGIPLLKPPSRAYGIVGGFGYFDVKLRTNLTIYAPLRTHVFQVMREIGNLLLVIQQIEHAYNAYQQHLRVSSSQFFPTAAVVSSSSASSSRAQSPRTDTSANTNGINASNPAPQLTSQLNDLQSFFTSSGPSPLSDLFSSYQHLSQDTASLYTPASSPRFFRIALQRLQALIDRVYEQWFPTSSTPPSISEPTMDMTRLLSYILFVLAQSEDIDGKDKVLGHDLRIFGDGFLFFCATILHFTGQRDRFNLISISNHIERLEMELPIDREKLSDKLANKKLNLNEIERQEHFILLFLANTKTQQQQLDIYCDALSGVLPASSHPHAS